MIINHGILFMAQFLNGKRHKNLYSDPAQPQRSDAWRIFSRNSGQQFGWGHHGVYIYTVYIYTHIYIYTYLLYIYIYIIIYAYTYMLSYFLRYIIGYIVGNLETIGIYHGIYHGNMYQLIGH